MEQQKEVDEKPSSPSPTTAEAGQEASSHPEQTQWLERWSLERWLQRNLNSTSAVRKLAAGAVKGTTEVFVSLLLARGTILFTTMVFGPIPSNLFAVLPGELTVGGVFFFIYYGGIKDVLGPN